jgi:hypothetical protein
MKIEDRSVTNSGIIRGNVMTGDAGGAAGVTPQTETTKTRPWGTPQVVAALIAGAAAIVAAVIGFLKH